MTRSEANQYLAVILETVAESDTRGTPSGVLYAALMTRINLDEYLALVSLAKQAELVTESSHVLAITEKGKRMVSKIVEARG